MRLSRSLPLLLGASLLAACAGLERQPRSGPPAKQGEGLLLNGARGLPDLQRGREAAAAGRVEDAERDLEPLAERGYPLAQTTLARLYARREDPQASAQAQHWYRSALPRVPDADLPLARLLLRTGDPARLAEAEALLRQAWEQRSEAEALSGLIDLYRQHPELDQQQQAEALSARAEQLAEPEVRGATIRWLRSTVALPGHQERLLGLCRRALEQEPECYVDLARDARRRASTDAQATLIDQALAAFATQHAQAATLGALAKALVEEVGGAESGASPASSADAASALAPNLRSCRQSAMQQAVEPPESGKPAAQAQPELATRVVRALAAADALAQVEAAAVVLRYPYLAADFEAEPALKAGIAAGLPEARLHLAQLYIEGRRGERDPQAALALLQAALQQEATEVRAHYLLGRLHQYGYLDEVDADAALQHLLLAARRGYLPADVALARLFASGRGVCPDYAAAYVFAGIAAQAGHAAMAQLRQELRARMPRGQAQLADHLFQQELAARGAAPARAAQAPAHGAHS